VSVPHSDGSAPEERTWLILDVVDSGCGIAECDLPHLFRPYSQLLSGLRRAGGTGLGLNLSRTLSTRCGGSLSCVSAPGKGSTFTVRIPYALGAAPPEPPPRDDAPPLLAVLPPADGASEGSSEVGPLTPGSGAPARPTGGFTRGHSIAGAPVHRALVVDDSPMSRMVLVRLLGAMGVAADAADGGQAGVDAVLAAEAAGSPYTIVFMDREMPPGLDGEAATRALRSAGCEVPIVALTGNALQDDRDSFFAAGCTAFLTKPATRDHIAAVLRSVDGVPEERRGSRRLQPWLHYEPDKAVEAPAPAETAPQDA
jgi:CheY-like chemotaxis protein